MKRVVLLQLVASNLRRIDTLVLAGPIVSTLATGSQESPRKEGPTIRTPVGMESDADAGAKR